MFLKHLVQLESLKQLSFYINCSDFDSGSATEISIRLPTFPNPECYITPDTWWKS